jgi:hypothetical protein
MGRAYIAGMVGVLAVTSGCPGLPPVNDDDADADVDADPTAPDAMPPAGGLTFRFVAKPELPTNPDGAFEVVIDEARYELTEIRAIGDAAPGDARTSMAVFEIQFDEGAETDLDFPLAPQGIYSFLFGDVERYYLRGQLVKGGESVDFQIDDHDHEVELAIDLGQLELGADPVVCTIEMDLRAITREVDWTLLEPEDGEDEIEIDNDFPAIDLLRDKADDFRKQ